MARLVYLVSLTAITFVVSSASEPTAVSASIAAAPITVSQCGAPITFICNNDPSPRPVSGPNLVNSAGGGSTSTESSSSIFSMVVDSISNLLSFTFASPSADDTTRSPDDLTVASSSVRAAANKRAAFYAAADLGSECRILSSDDNPIITTVHPDPQTMITNEREAAYFHVFCGDTTSFYNKAKATVESKLPDLLSSATADAPNPAVDINYFPKSMGEVRTASEGKKLRNTALLIVPGGSYQKLSIYESLVMPLEVLYEQANRNVSTGSHNLNATTTANDSNNGKIETLYPSDFVPIVVQYRVTPRSPQGPQEDISKVVRMLERYRQKRVASSLVASSTEGDDNTNNGAGQTPFGGDDHDMGITDAERKRLEEEKDQKRLSPAMLGLTDDFKIVIVGFSAGGHAAASYLSMTSSIPIASAVLVYPVIAMDRPDIAHYHSALNLLSIEPNATEPVKPEGSEAVDSEPVGAAAAAAVAAPPILKADPLNANFINAAEGDDAATSRQTTPTRQPRLSPAMHRYNQAMARYTRDRYVLERYSPQNHPSNFPACVYLTHTASDAVVDAQHSQLMYDSLIDYRKRREERAAGGSGIRAEAAALAAASSTTTTEASLVAAVARGFAPAASENATATAVPPAAKTTKTTFDSDFGVGLRVYPNGPHGRWWLQRGIPELQSWWLDTLDFLEENGC